MMVGRQREGIGPGSFGAAGRGGAPAARTPRRAASREIAHRAGGAAIRTSRGTAFDEAELEELAASIRDKGVLQPILVRAAPDKPGQYQIVAGERRWRAAQLAGLRLIPALVRELADSRRWKSPSSRTSSATDLSPIEEADGYRR